jgi:hypothetical protein
MAIDVGRFRLHVAAFRESRRSFFAEKVAAGLDDRDVARLNSAHDRAAPRRSDRLAPAHRRGLAAGVGQASHFAE